MLLAWVVVILLTNCRGCEGCVETDWTYFPLTGYYYKVFCDATTYEDAEQICQDYGGHLASIHSEEENQFVYDLVTPSNKHNDYGDYIWIGLKRDEYSDWYWTDGTPTDFTNWSKSEPNNYNKQEFCGQIYSNSPANSLDTYWNNLMCSTRMRQFVCKTSEEFIYNDDGGGIDENRFFNLKCERLGDGRSFLCTMEGREGDQIYIS